MRWRVGIGLVPLAIAACCCFPLVEAGQVVVYNPIDKTVLGRSASSIRDFTISVIQFYEDAKFSKLLSSNKDSQDLQEVIKRVLKKKLIAQGFAIVSLEAVNPKYVLEIDFSHTAEFFHLVHWVNTRVKVYYQKSIPDYLLFTVSARARIFGKDDASANATGDILAAEFIRTLKDKLGYAPLSK